MPTAPLKPCCWPGCPALTHDRFCTEHRRAENQRRGSASRRGYGVQHRRWRLLILARDPVCRDPARRHPEEERASIVADHVVPLANGGDWSEENGQGLCIECHNAKSARDRRG